MPHAHRLLMPLLLAATLAGADPVPADRRIAWDPGIPGGIPAFPRPGGRIIDAKASYGATGDGVTDDTGAIQRAIDAAAPGDVVHLPRGSYAITTTLVLDKGAVLRGDGVATRIEIHGGDVGIHMGSRSSSFGPAIDLAGGYAKGATQVTLAQDASVGVGDFVVVDELNPSYVDATGGGYLGEDRSGDGYSAGLRCVAQMDQVVAVSGRTITLAKPLYRAYDASLDPRLYVADLVEDAGIEDLFIERVDNVGGQDSHIIALFECAHCWVRNTETHLGKGDHCNLDYVYASDIVDNFLYMGHNDYGPDAGFASIGVDGGASFGPSYRGFGYDSGRNYGIHVAWGPDSDNLVQNNIIDSCRHALVFEGPGCGNVIAYNYALNGIVYNDMDWETGTASNHGVHPAMNLWEGNWIDSRLCFDHTHGSGSDNTVFRNRITHGPAWKTGGRWAVDLETTQYRVNVVGNVLGAAGMGGTLVAVGNGEAIYRFGHPDDGTDTVTDPQVAATVLLDGNWDFVSDAFAWDAADADHRLPASLFLAAKPAWFGDLAWPAFGPATGDPTTLVSGTIPAKRCFELQRLASGGTFDPAAFYGAASGGGATTGGSAGNGATGGSTGGGATGGATTTTGGSGTAGSTASGGERTRHGCGDGAGLAVALGLLLTLAARRERGV